MSKNDLDKLWKEFGKNMQLIGILMAVSMVAGITGIVATIFIFISLGIIRKINYRLNSPYLHDFRTKYIASFVLKLISIPFLAIGIMQIVFPVTGILPPVIFYSIPNWVLITIGSSVILIGLILFIVAFSIETKAWDNLKDFLEQNREMFPAYISQEAIDGASKLRTGALLYALGIFVVTAIIGFILQIIGFFKLAKIEGIISETISKPATLTTHVPAPPQPPKAPEPLSPPVITQTQETRVVGDRSKFCPNCGAELKGVGNYCPECGSVLS